MCRGTLLRGLLLSMLSLLSLLSLTNAATTQDVSKIINDLRALSKNQVPTSERLFWTTPSPPTTGDCGTTTTTDTSFSSPGYPNEDSNDRACALNVDPPANTCAVKVSMRDAVFKKTLCMGGNFFLVTGAGAKYGASDPFCWNITGYSFTIPLANPDSPEEVTLVFAYRAPFKFLADVEFMTCDDTMPMPTADNCGRRFRSGNIRRNSRHHKALNHVRNMDEYVRMSRARQFHNDGKEIGNPEAGWLSWIYRPIQYISDLKRSFSSTMNGKNIDVNYYRDSRTTDEDSVANEIWNKFSSLKFKHEKKAKIADFGTGNDATSQYFSDLVDVLINLLGSIKGTQESITTTTTTTTTTTAPTTPMVTASRIPAAVTRDDVDLNEIIVGPSVILEEAFEDISVALPIVERTQYPWTVEIERLDAGANDGIVICSGTIVSEYLVLTSASCFWDTPLAEVSVTLMKTFSNGNTVKESLPVMGIRYHYAYRDQQHGRNLALLQLANKLVLSDSVQPVCLPTSSTPMTGSSGMQAGYDFLSIFRAAPVGLITRQTCVERFAMLNPSSDILCSQPTTINVPEYQCPIEQGGGLVSGEYSPGSTSTLWGVLSSGSLCNFDPTFVLYTDVGRNSDWINMNLM